jgi:hypothetical protein
VIIDFKKSGKTSTSDNAVPSRQRTKKESERVEKNSTRSSNEHYETLKQCLYSEFRKWKIFIFCNLHRLTFIWKIGPDLKTRQQTDVKTINFH